MRIFFKWSFLFGVLAVLLILLAWGSSRAIYPTQAQRDAIKFLEDEPALKGRNAFTLVWSWKYDVPGNKLAEVIEEDARKIESFSPDLTIASQQAVEFVSAAEAYSSLAPSDDDRKKFCSGRNVNCLAKVRDDIDGFSALVDRNRLLLNRIGRIGDYDYMNSPFRARLETPIPHYYYASYTLTEASVLFANGQTEFAISNLCDQIVIWRRLGRQSSSLLEGMLAATFVVDQFGYTLAHMLAEVASINTVPIVCQEAFSPPLVSEISVCKAMQGEFRVISNSVEDLSKSMKNEGWAHRLGSALFFDEQATLGVYAESFAEFCSEHEQHRLAEDLALNDSSGGAKGFRFDCLGNLMGCFMTTSLPAYDHYRLRFQDYGAKLRVLGTLGWMLEYAESGESILELLNSRPVSLRSPTRHIEFDPDSRTLKVALYEGGRGDYWSIPMPPAFYQVDD